MNVLWVLAHPETRSLNGSLHRAGLTALTEAGHRIEVSDLYAMKWNPVVDRDDYAIEDERLYVPRASKQAFVERTLSPDILAEQAKLDWAELLVLQFPLWWFGMPAILKGWIDRLFVRGYAYGLPDPDRPGRSLRYGTGGLAGKRALAVVTIGARPEGHQPRGIEGALGDVLFPLLHGTFFYTGMQALPPLAIHNADRLSQRDYEAAVTELRARLDHAETTPPIPYRTQNGGDYDDSMTLLPHVATTQTGLDAHIA